MKPRAPSLVEIRSQATGGKRHARIQWGAEDGHPAVRCEFRLYRQADGRAVLKIVHVDPGVTIVRDEEDPS